MRDREPKVQISQKADHDLETGGQGEYFMPAVDIFEDGNQVTVIAEMPGVSIGGAEVGLEDDQLVIAGTGEPDPTDAVRILLKEYETCRYLRRFSLPETIDRQRIRASLDKGVLTVILPKTPPARPKKIDIHAG